MSSISYVQMVVESQPEAPHTQELHQWQSQKEHNRNKENTYAISFSTLTPSNMRQITQMEGFSGCCNAERIYLPLSFFSLNQHKVLHKCLWQCTSQPIVISQLYIVYTYHIILMYYGHIAGLKGVLIKHNKVNQQGISD